MKKKALTFGLISVAALVLAGCSAPTALEAGTKMCADSLKSEIKEAITEPEAGWANTEINPNVTSSESRDGSEYAYDIYGTAEVSTPDDTTFTVDWECFTQTADGKTYAEVTVDAD